MDTIVRAHLDKAVAAARFGSTDTERAVIQLAAAIAILDAKVEQLNDDARLASHIES